MSSLVVGLSNVNTGSGLEEVLLLNVLGYINSNLTKHLKRLHSAEYTNVST